MRRLSRLLGEARGLIESSGKVYTSAGGIVYWDAAKNVGNALAKAGTRLKGKVNLSVAGPATTKMWGATVDGRTFTGVIKYNNQGSAVSADFSLEVQGEAASMGEVPSFVDAADKLVAQVFTAIGHNIGPIQPGDLARLVNNWREGRPVDKKILIGLMRQHEREFTKIKKIPLSNDPTVINTAEAARKALRDAAKKLK
jgi:carbon monoxide dehydrogenase subunit G